MFEASANPSNMEIGQTELFNMIGAYWNTKAHRKSYTILSVFNRKY